MKKKILLASLTILLTFCAIGLTACGHEHDYKVQSSDTMHWYECECGHTYGYDVHGGGEATCKEKAKCSICGVEYGNIAPHDYKVQSSDTMHWYKCECGDTYGYDVHVGGEATCKEKAKCSICGVEYGELGEHMGGEATCKEKAKCSTCGVEYGNIAPHDYVDSVCKWCQKEQKITFNTLTVNGNKVYGKVRNSTLEFSFKEEVSINGVSDYIVSYDKYLSQSVETKIVPLSEGDNIIYVAEKIAGQIGDIYEVTIRRLPIHIVSFDTANGSVVQSQYIEEEYFATIPANPTRAGYVFNSWDYDFSKPITKNTKITASWTANTNTPYKVEYYLENLEDNNYTLNETVNKTGTTDTTVSTTAKNIEHFTFNSYKSNLSGNLNGDGTTVLKVYYTRDKYTVTFDGNGGTLTSGKLSQTVKYGGSVTAPTFERTGYTFTGYDKTNYTNISESFTVTAQWKINQYTLTIVYNNGEKDKEITQDYNSAIESIANPTRAGYTFNGWSESIPTNMPAENLTITAGWLAIFNLNGGKITGLTTHGKTLTQLDIPNAIDGVNITSIGDRAFYDCSKLTSVTIGSGVQSIGERAFAECTSLTSVVIGYGVTSIGDGAFSGCYYLRSIVIPNSVTSIGAYAFFGCNSSLASVVIPNSVTSIGERAFSFCTQLISIEIPNSVTSIGEGAFYYCSSLKSIVIPDSVTSIGDAVFGNCNSLTSIKYRGTESQWQAIKKGTFGDKYTGYYTITYNYTGE